MFKIQFAILHEGCWGSAIHQEFPSYQFSSIDCRWIKERVAHILLARGEPEKFKEIMEYLKRRQDVLGVEYLHEDDHSLHLRVITRSEGGQFSDLFFDHDCFPIMPTRFEKDKEIWTLGTAKKENIAKVHELLAQKHTVTILSSREETISDLLTQKQREALTYAHHMGYYEWPREKSIQEICELLKVPKTVFLSHLRKAEQKVMDQFLGDS